MTKISPLKSGTTLVGIVAKDGIVLAADKRASAGYLVANKESQKLIKISEELVVATAGNVSDIQMNVKVIKAQLRLLELRRGKPATIKESSHLLGSMLFGNIRRSSYIIPSIAAFLIGGYTKEEGGVLYDLEPAGSVTEHKKYASDGSGSVFALGVLEANYKDGMNLQDATKLAIQAVQAAIERDVASGNGIEVYNITKDGAEKVYDGRVNMAVQ